MLYYISLVKTRMHEVTLQKSAELCNGKLQSLHFIWLNKKITKVCFKFTGLEFFIC
jgi:hypothetical protein